MLTVTNVVWTERWTIINNLDMKCSAETKCAPVIATFVSCGKIAAI